MPASAARTKEPTQQDVCIDLPGETVQCWRSSDNLKVVLRKHRDVIFDLNLGKGKTYTVQATASDFYNARDKKLIYAKCRDVVTFNDGERMHLWVTRSFGGALVLKCGSEILMKLTPNEVDQNQYDNAPKTKPAPIIVALGPGRTAKTLAPSTLGVSKPPHTAVITPVPQSAPIDEECALVCVVEGTIKGIPAGVAAHFKQGGGKSGLADIDPFETATRNWIWGQVGGALAYAGDNWGWLRASLDSRTHAGFKLVKAKIHIAQGKVRFYFSGYSKYNQVFGPGGFNPGHPRIMNIFAGAGKLSSSLAAMGKSVAGTFRGNALCSFIFSSATAYAEWKDDLQKDGYDFAASLLMALAKAVISAVLVGAFVALICLFALGGAIAAVPIILVGALTVVIGVIVNYGVDGADKTLGKVASGDSNKDGLAASIAPWLREAAATVTASWDVLVEKFPADYSSRVRF